MVTNPPINDAKSRAANPKGATRAEGSLLAYAAAQAAVTKVKPETPKAQRPIAEFLNTVASVTASSRSPERDVGRETLRRDTGDDAPRERAAGYLCF